MPLTFRPRAIGRLLLHFSLPLLLCSPTFAENSAGAEGEVDPQKLRHLLKHDCGSCHGMTLRGGLGADLTWSRMKDRDPKMLQTVILNGIPGTAMPPWKGLLSEKEAAYLAQLLKEGSYDQK